jgi:hypothetical protein
MINLLSLFGRLESEKYCVVKINPAFPEYRPGSDVDIFVYDPASFMSKLVRYLGDIAEKNHEIPVNQIHEGHVQLDYKIDGKLEIRFDLYTVLPRYRCASVKESLFDSVIEGSVFQQYEKDGERSAISVPSVIDNCLIRYLEYNEYFATNPDKIKHAEYIVRNLADVQVDDFLAKLHHYISFPRVVQDKRGGRRGIRSLRTSALWGIAKAVRRTLKRFIQRLRSGGVRLL